MVAVHGFDSRDDDQSPGFGEASCIDDGFQHVVFEMVGVKFADDVIHYESKVLVRHLVERDAFGNIGLEVVAVEQVDELQRLFAFAIHDIGLIYRLEQLSFEVVRVKIADDLCQLIGVLKVRSRDVFVHF